MIMLPDGTPIEIVPQTNEEIIDYVVSEMKNTFADCMEQGVRVNIETIKGGEVNA
jgi:hypothetical protein